MIERMKVTLSNGKTRVLKSPACLKKINYNREAMFVFSDGAIYYGYCDGKISSEGMFHIEDTVHCGCHLVSQLIGWCYLENQ